MINIRNMIIEQMSSINDSGIDCSICQTSECCTFVKNSMQITPLEAIELIFFLSSQDRLDQNLIASLYENIKNYRLDKQLPSDGRRLFSRRSYTCPFLKEGSLACSISRFAKPYGCLAFNPNFKNSKDSSTCSSDQKLLEAVAGKYQDNIKSMNNYIKKSLDIDFDKLAIPLALITILERNSIDHILKTYQELT